MGFQGLGRSFREAQDYWLIVPLFAGSIAAMIPGVFLLRRMKRQSLVVAITLISIALALPVLIREH